MASAGSLQPPSVLFKKPKQRADLHVAPGIIVVAV